MRRRAAIAIAVFVSSADARAQSWWRDDTDVTIGTTAEWTNKVELADVDGDGWLDIVFANGAGYSMPGPAEASRVFRNRGAWSGAPPYFEEITSQVFGSRVGHARVIEVRDLDGDGDDDIVVGNTFGDPSRLYLRDGGGWIDVTTTNLPMATPHVGDLDAGDVDGDGDLDLVLADWGADLAIGAPPRLYRNDGGAVFVDVTATAMPAIAVAWSWELDLVDVDGDFDLDLVVASKLGSGSFLLRNDGAGVFSDDSAASLPQFTNNYDVEAMDIDGDGDLDLATINDGPNRRDHIFVADAGRFTDGTDTRLTGTANPPADDNVAAFVDADADGDADLIVGSLAGPDRLLLNNGSGTFAIVDGGMPDATPGTLGIAIGDLDHDGRPDIVDGQGEAAFADRVYRGTDLVAVDTAPPRIGPLGVAGAVVRARVHDNKTPANRLDFAAVVLRYRGASDGEVAMAWYGEHLWRAALPAPGDYTIQVCATDARGNQACSDERSTAPMIDGGAGVTPDAGGGDDPGGCGCRGGDDSGWLVVVLAVLAWRRTLRRRSRSLRTMASRATV